MKQKVWTPARRAMGNIVPALICLPFGVAGVILYRYGDSLLAPSMLLLYSFPIVAWFALNATGLYQNRSMRSALNRLFEREKGGIRAEKYFVGLATPQYRGVLDPHEDVGFLVFHEDRLEIYGEFMHFEIPWDRLVAIRLRPNPHSYVGLGGWVSIEWTGGTILVEPRENRTLLRNNRMRKTLLQRLQSRMMLEKT